VIDGPVLLGEALDAGVAVTDVFAAPEAPGDLLDRAAAAGAQIHAVSAEVLAKAAAAVTPNALAAIARRVEVPTARALDAARRGPLALVLDGVSDPGNAGTLLRSAEAAGFAAVLFTSGSVDPYAPKCVRSSAGSIFRMVVTRGGEAPTVLDEVAATGRRRIATRPAAARPHTEVDLSGPVAIVLGNEAHGLPGDLDAHVDEWVTIPMSGRAESLNVAMAGTLLCFEVLRRG